MEEENKEVEAVVELMYTPGPNSIDISPEKDGKLWKEVIRPADPNLKETGACDGMEVRVHYIGTLPDGHEFDRSDRRSPFNFVLGDGKVIKAWDIGVKGMKTGEVYKIICHPDLGYGGNATGSIPANSTLIFEIEMVSYTPEDLTKNKTGHILRYKVKNGNSKYLFPNSGSLVEVIIEGKYNDTVVLPSQSYKFNLGEGVEVGIPYGIEKALVKMSTGEQSVLEIKGKKYGPPQSVYDAHSIPEDATLEYVVELKSMENSKEAWQMEGPEKLEASKQFKEKGGKFFSSGNYRLAAHNYKLIVDYLKAEALLTGEEEEERKALLLASYLNQAICYIKLNKPVLAIRNCDDALDMSPSNTKGLYRRGLARLAVNEPEAAKTDLLKLLETEPDNKAALQQIQMCDKKIKEHKLKEKQIYVKMFENLGKSEKSTEKPLPNGMDNVCEWEKEGGVPDETTTS